MKFIIALLSILLPWTIKRYLLQTFLGYSLSPDSYIGKSFVFPKNLEMAAGSRIGHLTICKGLDSIKLGEYGHIGHLNWITGFPSNNTRHFQLEKNRFPALIVEEHAAVTNRHLIDCTDTVRIGRFSTFAGFRSQILTHSIDLRANRQSCAPVEIGQYCFVGTQCVLVKGSKLPDKSVLGAGSILTKEHSETGMLYSGNPAAIVREMDVSSGYFVRPRGFVD